MWVKPVQNSANGDTINPRMIEVVRVSTASKLRIENKDVAIAYKNDCNMSRNFRFWYLRNSENDNTAEMHVCNDAGSFVHIVTSIILCKMLKKHDDNITIAGVMGDEQR